MMGQKKQVHDMREILLLEDDTTLGRGIQLALQVQNVTIYQTETDDRDAFSGAGNAGAEEI